MKEIWNNILASFAILYVRIFDIIAFLLMIIITYPSLALLKLTAKYHINSWFLKMLVRMYADGEETLDALSYSAWTDVTELANETDSDKE